MNSAVAAITNAANTINTSFLRLNSLVQTAIMNPVVGVPVAPVKPSIGSNKFLYQQLQVLNNWLAVVEAQSIQRRSSLSTALSGTPLVGVIHVPICTPGLHPTSQLQTPVLPTNPQLEILPGERFGPERFLGTSPKDSASPIASVHSPIVSVEVSPKSLDPVSFLLLDPRPETGISFCLTFLLLNLN